MLHVKNKKNCSTLCLILLLAVSAIVVALPAVSAQENPTKATVAYLGAMPNPVGVNQQVLLHIGITDYLSDPDEGWEGITVLVTAPDGSQTTLGPYTTDSTGGTGDIFVPDQAGTYILQTHFPTQWTVISGYFATFTGNITYLESYSEELELVVQEDAIEYYPGTSLPSEYWDRPIDAQLREWSTVAGSWTHDPDNLYAPYNDAPETAHILWTKELTSGGLTGGELGALSYGTGDAYEGKFPTRYILNGRLYYEVGGSSGLTETETICVDLSTGEEVWRKVFMDNQSISFTQILYWDGMNYHGAFAYLYVSKGGFDYTTWTTLPTTWYAFDAYTGDWRFTVEGIPSGTTIYGPNNEIYILQVDTTNGWMALWSMNDCLISSATGYGSGSWGNTVEGNTFVVDELPDGWLWNVSIPTDLPSSVLVAGYEDKVVLSSSSTEEVVLAGLSLASGDEGDLLYNETYEAPDDWAEMNLTVSGSMGGFVASSLEEGVAVLFARETREHYGFSLETGEYIWGPTPSEHYLNALEDSPAAITNIAYGYVYTASVGGVVYCYDAQTGDVVWTYEANDPYSEMLWSNNWWVKPLFISDGKIYVAHTEHSAVDPRPRGAPFICLDAMTGEEIWRIDGAFRTTRWGGRAIIGDSIMVGMDTYDQQIYAVGKGPTSLTAEAPLSGVTVGSPITISGTILDVSPGTEDSALTARFPNGVPAICDEDMSEWMLYVYKQFERPADADGVTVVLCAIDPEGNYMDIDRTTSDAYGNWALAFTPDMEGTYQIIATFEGSGAYYGSTTTTYMTVGSAASASTPIEPEEPVDTETPIDTEEPATNASFISTEVAIIAAVAVVAVIGVAAFFLLKRK